MPALDDPTSLDIDLSGLTDLPIDDDDVLSVSADDAADAENEPTFIGDEKQLKPETENIRLGDEDETMLASMADIDKISGQSGHGLDAESPGDTVEQPQIDAGGDTAEQPVHSSRNRFRF